MTRMPYLPPGPDPEGDWFADDPALRRFLSKHLPAKTWEELEPRLAALGREAPRSIDALARRADKNPPQLSGNEVVFDESYHALQQAARTHEVFTYSWHHDAPRLATFGLGYLYGQAECGYYCPACMTDGAAFVLQRHDAPRETIARLVQRDAQGAFEGAMLLTEPQGGSDVGATRTLARKAGDTSALQRGLSSSLPAGNDAEGDGWLLTGDKWFASNANAGVVLTLARMPGAAEGTRGLGLFLLSPDDNPGFLRRKLKDKLGVRSMATAEVELRDAKASLVAGENAGFKAMAEMVNLSRLYNSVASVAVARRALREGQRNATWRKAFGKSLGDLPLYQRALAELANDVRGALFLALDTAIVFDKASHGDEESYRLLRALTPIAKAGTARLAVDAASAACEMLGGNGYVEEWVTPRLLRDAQVLPIWEGTSNVQALDLLRGEKDGALRALSEDSSRRAPELATSWAKLSRPTESSALRILYEAYHLRVASLLSQDARDGDDSARAHARAYAQRHVTRDFASFEADLPRVGRLLSGIGDA